MATKARLNANKKYDDAHTKRYGLKLNLDTDSDVIYMLDYVAPLEEGGKQGYIKNLIREDMAYRGIHLP